MAKKYYGRFKNTTNEIYAFKTEEARNKWVDFQDELSQSLGENHKNTLFDRVAMSESEALGMIIRHKLIWVSPSVVFTDCLPIDGCTAVYTNKEFKSVNNNITTEVIQKNETKRKNRTDNDCDNFLDISSRKILASTTLQNAFTIGTKKIAYVPVSLLAVPKFQRDTQNHLTQIAKNWDDSKCDVLRVSYNADSALFDIMDGQHRAAAAKMRGIDFLVCEIFSGLSLSEEATMFVESNINSKKLSPFDTYKANLYISEGEDTELSKIVKRISKVCERYGVVVKHGQSCGMLKSVPHARIIMKKEGEKGLEFIFDVIQGSHWDRYKNGYSYMIMEALRKIYDNNIDNLEYVKNRLCNRMVNETPESIISLSNRKYPNLKRTARYDAVFADMLK